MKYTSRIYVRLRVFLLSSCACHMLTGTNLHRNPTGFFEPMTSQDPQSNGTSDQLVHSKGFVERNFLLLLSWENLKKLERKATERPPIICRFWSIKLRIQAFKSTWSTDLICLGRIRISRLVLHLEFVSDLTDVTLSCNPLRSSGGTRAKSVWSTCWNVFDSLCFWCCFVLNNVCCWQQRRWHHRTRCSIPLCKN